MLLDKLLERCREKGLVKERGKQRTDATHVLAAIRVMNRLELVAETMRAALNALATVAPSWLRRVAPPTWYERYSRRIEDGRLPKNKEERKAYAQSVGEDGFQLLDLLDAAEVPEQLGSLSEINTLRLLWARHYERRREETSAGPQDTVRFKNKRE